MPSHAGKSANRKLGHAKLLEGIATSISIVSQSQNLATTGQKLTSLSECKTLQAHEAELSH